MRKKLSLFLAFLVVLGLTPKISASNSPFDDVPSDHWAYSEILEAYNDGVMKGTGVSENGAPVFSPSGKLNTAQFVTVLTRAFYNDEVLNAEGPWPNPNFEVAYAHNLLDVIDYFSLYDMNGKANKDTTRKMMAQMMYNVMVDKGITTPDTTPNIPDIALVDPVYRAAVTACYSLNLLSGVDSAGNFSPEGVLNRAQTAVIYTRLKEVIGSGSSIKQDLPQKDEETSGPTLTNGMPVTEENVLVLIKEYHDGKIPTSQRAFETGFTSYENGAHYDAYEPSYTIMGLGNGVECAKFAFAFWDELFGNVPFREIEDYADIRPGDLIHFPGHWAIATMSPYHDEFDGNDYLCIEWVGGGSTGSIGWQEDGHASSVIVGPTGPRLDSAYTRYPE